MLASELNFMFVDTRGTNYLEHIVTASFYTLSPLKPYFSYKSITKLHSLKTKFSIFEISNSQRESSFLSSLIAWCLQSTATEASLTESMPKLFAKNDISCVHIFSNLPFAFFAWEKLFQLRLVRAYSLEFNLTFNINILFYLRSSEI